MKAKYFLTGLVMAAVLCCISCSNKTKTEEPSKADQYLPHDEIVEFDCSEYVSLFRCQNNH